MFTSLREPISSPYLPGGVHFSKWFSSPPSGSSGGGGVGGHTTLFLFLAHTHLTQPLNLISAYTGEASIHRPLSSAAACSGLCPGHLGQPRTCLFRLMTLNQGPSECLLPCEVIFKGPSSAQGVRTSHHLLEKSPG